VVKPPPRWSNENAVVAFVRRWRDVREYEGVMEAQIEDACDTAVLLIRREPDLRTLVTMLHTGKHIDARTRALIADHLDGRRRKRGRPKKSLVERTASSLLPDAEAEYHVVIDFLREHYPQQPMRDIRERAIVLAVERFAEFEHCRVSVEALRNYMARGAGDRRRLSPKARVR
jgi:hypothetical protein